MSGLCTECFFEKKLWDCYLYDLSLQEVISFIQKCESMSLYGFITSLYSFITSLYGFITSLYYDCFCFRFETSSLMQLIFKA